MHARIGMALLLVVGCWRCYAQEPSPAGGKWLRSDTVDGPNNRKVVRFYLPADEAELGRSPSIELICTGDGRLVRTRYFADTDLPATTGDYKRYDDPAFTPKIRIDKKVRLGPVWDLYADGKSAQIDAKTVRAMFKATEMRVQYADKSTDHFVDSFLVGGLDTGSVRRACGDNGWFSK
jgi:hypothetical protein